MVRSKLTSSISGVTQVASEATIARTESEQFTQMSTFDNVHKLIKEWRPDALPTELKYRDSLVTFLRERLKDSHLEKEYRHSGTTIDIYVKQSGFWGPSEVFIELKRNLLQKTQLDRLVGQVESLRPGKNALIVVLCGETNPSLEVRFREKYGLTNQLFVPTAFTLILKPTVALPTEQRNPQARGGKTK